MKWTVVWKADAENDLAEMWVEALDKAAISAAANHIDALLRKDPFNTGESRAEDDRVYFEAPLAVLFTVDELDRKVFVERVWRISRLRMGIVMRDQNEGYDSATAAPPPRDWIFRGFLLGIFAGTILALIVLEPFCWFWVKYPGPFVAFSALVGGALGLFAGVVHRLLRRR